MMALLSRMPLEMFEFTPFREIVNQLSLQHHVKQKL